MAYTEIIALLEPITSIEQLHETFQHVARHIHIDIPTLNQNERLGLINRLLALTPLFPNDETLKKQFNDLFQQIIIAPDLFERNAGGDMPLFLTSIQLQDPMPEKAKELFHQQLVTLKKPAAYFFSHGQFFKAHENEHGVFFHSIHCVNEAYPIDALQQDLTPNGVLLAEDTFICINPNLRQDANAFKRIIACTNTKLSSRFSEDHLDYFTLDSSEKPWEPLQINYQYQANSLTAWHFIHYIKEAELLTLANLIEFIRLVRYWAFSMPKACHINWDNLHYAIQVLANANALSQSWLTTLFQNANDPTKEKIDFLYFQLQFKLQHPEIETRLLQNEYTQFAKKDQHQRALTTLFLRLFVNPTPVELRAIREFCASIPDRCESGKAACLAVQHLLRRELLDKDTCRILFNLDKEPVLELLCESLFFLREKYHVALTKKRFIAFLQQPFPGPRMAAFNKVARWELSQICQNLIANHHSKEFLLSIKHCPPLTESQFYALERCTTLITERGEALYGLHSKGLLTEDNVQKIFQSNSSELLHQFQCSHQLTQAIFDVSFTFLDYHYQRLTALCLLNKLNLLSSRNQEIIVNSQSVEFLKAIHRLDLLLTQPLLDALHQCSSYPLERATALHSIYINSNFSSEQRIRNTKIILETTSEEFLKAIEQFNNRDSEKLIVYSQTTFDDLLNHPTHQVLRLEALRSLETVELLTSHRQYILNDALSEKALSAIATLWHDGGSRIPMNGERLVRVLSHQTPQLFLNTLKAMPDNLLTEENIDRIEGHTQLETLRYFFRNIPNERMTTAYFNHLLTYAVMLGSEGIKDAYARIPHDQRTDRFYDNFFVECARLQDQPIAGVEAAIIGYLDRQLRRGNLPERGNDVGRQVFAGRQTTHIATVHVSSSESARKLKQTYADLIKTPAAINAILETINIILDAHAYLNTFIDTWHQTDAQDQTQQYLDQLLATIPIQQVNWPFASLMTTPEAVNKLSENFNSTTARFFQEKAKQAFQRISVDAYGEHIDSTSNTDVRTLLALVWLAIQDKDRRGGPLLDATTVFVKGLYDIARGGNLNDDGIDNKHPENSFICAPGAFNKLIELLVGMHPDPKKTHLKSNSTTIYYQKIVSEEVRKDLINSLSEVKTMPEAEAFNEFLIQLERDGMDDRMWAVIQPRVSDALWNAFMVGATKEAVDAFSRHYPSGKTNQQYQDLISAGRDIDLAVLIKTEKLYAKLTEKKATLPIATPTLAIQLPPAEPASIKKDITPLAAVPTLLSELVQSSPTSNQRATVELAKIQALLTHQIEGFRWNLFALFFRSYQEKRSALVSLRSQLTQTENVVPNQTVHDVLSKWKTATVLKTIQAHRNRFFSSVRPEVKTNTERLIDTIESTYGSCKVIGVGKP